MLVSEVGAAGSAESATVTVEDVAKALLLDVKIAPCGLGEWSREAPADVEITSLSASCSAEVLV